MAQDLETVVHYTTCGRGKEQLLGFCVFATMGVQKDLDRVAGILLKHKVVTHRTLHEGAKRCAEQARA